MEKLYKVPLIFLLIASCMGLLLRSQMIFPFVGITFSFLLHGHSHVMFLGWVFNVLFLGFVIQFVPGDHKTFKAIFWLLQILVAGMLISFPLQGYGFYSILFSTLHTCIVFVFIVLFFKRTKQRPELSVWLARVSLVFFVISSIGPFSLGYLKANDLDQSNLYRCSIYLYLHFQYNGVFFFGILSLFVNLLEKHLSKVQIGTVRLACQLFALACLPAFLLSILWTKPGFIYNIIGALAAGLQLFALAIFSRVVIQFIRMRSAIFRPQFQPLLFFIYVALVLKLILQLFSADPRLADFINENRPLIIGYLHLMLVGVISLFLIGWLIQNGLIANRLSLWANRLLLPGFIVSEILIFVSPFTNGLFDTTPIDLQLLTLGFSCLIVAGVVLYSIGSFRSEHRTLF